MSAGVRVWAQIAATGLMAALAWASGFADRAPPAPTIYERAVANAGDTERLRHVLQKAAAGESVTIVAFGESITAGAHAAAGKGYVDLVRAWLTERFPKGQVAVINAGVGGSTTERGLARYEQDAAKHRPDLLILEFAVNDYLRPNEDRLAELVRRIHHTAQPGKEPAVLLLEVMGVTGESAQPSHANVARTYRLPMLSMHDALWPEIESGRLDAASLFQNEWHPNTAGHAAIADLVTHYLESVASDGREGHGCGTSAGSAQSPAR